MLYFTQAPVKDVKAMRTGREQMELKDFLDQNVDKLSEFIATYEEVGI